MATHTFVTNDFKLATSDTEKAELSQKWQNYISDKEIWISFYEWKKLSPKAEVHMMEGGSETPPKHKWKSLEG